MRGGIGPKMTSRTEALLGIWWISWLGIIGGFLSVGVFEYRIARSLRHGASSFCLALLFITSLMWAIFFLADHKSRKKIDGENSRQVVVTLLTLTGSILAVFTLLGIWFFTYIAPRII
jgi:hypothetical protein